MEADHDIIIRLEERFRAIHEDVREIKEALNGRTPNDQSSIRYRLHKLEDDVGELVDEAGRLVEAHERTFTRRDLILVGIFTGIVAVTALATLILTLTGR